MYFFTKGSPAVVCRWTMSTYSDPMQYHGKRSGFSKTALGLILDTKVLNLDFFFLIGFIRL